MRRCIALLLAVLEAPASRPRLRGAAADCLSEVVAKRMEAGPKLNLVQVRASGV
jgi:hypothetical protein